MLKERIGYIDSLKGFAILLMVMGHVIAGQFQDYNMALYEMPRSTMFLFRFIYSFHMHLLMFCSGLFILSKPVHTMSDVGISIWKRVKSLLLPAIFAGCILWLQRGSFGYWFLWTLFQFVVITLLIYYLCSYIPRCGKHIFVIFLCVISLCIMLYLSHFYRYERLPLIDVGHWRFYPYFCLGIICAQYDVIERLLSKNIVFTISLIVFGFLTYWVTIEGNSLPKQSITFCMLPISAIFALVYFFKEGLKGASNVGKWLQNLGEHSLEVYILHLFFLPMMYPIGEYVQSMANVGGGAQTIFFVQFVTSLTVSVIIIYVCYMVMNVINKSDVLSLLLLGRKSVIDAK